MVTKIGFVIGTSGGFSQNEVTQTGAYGTGASLLDPAQAVDGDPTTYATLTVVGNGNGQIVNLYAVAPFSGQTATILAWFSASGGPARRII
jgi:hypothetical protein